MQGGQLETREVLVWSDGEETLLGFQTALFLLYTHMQKSQWGLCSLLIKTSILFMRVWEDERVRRKKGEREIERENRKSFQKVCKGRERKRVVFQERRGKWKFSFKRSALMLKSQVEGFIWEAEDHSITSHLRDLSVLMLPYQSIWCGSYISVDPTCQYRRLKRRVQSWSGKTTWRRARQPTPVFLLGESHRQRNLVDHRVAKNSVWLKQLSTILLWKNFPWLPWQDTLHFFFHPLDFLSQQPWLTHPPAPKWPDEDPSSCVQGPIFPYDCSPRQSYQHP